MRVPPQSGRADAGAPPVLRAIAADDRSAPDVGAGAGPAGDSADHGTMATSPADSCHDDPDSGGELEVADPFAQRRRTADVDGAAPGEVVDRLAAIETHAVGPVEEPRLGVRRGEPREMPEETRPSRWRGPQPTPVFESWPEARDDAREPPAPHRAAPRAGRLPAVSSAERRVPESEPTVSRIGGIGVRVSETPTRRRSDGPMVAAEVGRRVRSPRNEGPPTGGATAAIEHEFFWEQPTDNVARNDSFDPAALDFAAIEDTNRNADPWPELPVRLAPLADIRRSSPSVDGDVRGERLRREQEGTRWNG
ncbi:MAG: hypothetical protein AB7O52_01910 [Planctomycetota bacterium]